MNVHKMQPIAPAETGAVTRSQAGTGASSLSSQGKGQTSARSADQTSLSSASTLVSQAIGLPDVDMAKVAEVQNALASGTYQVSSSDVAAKLIDSLTR
ncbi:flagellar biosynthesis anti-sigma factor FlgM [Silvibacterium acidisoli]|uniref:flagellar biosynthesis anti-sigma factor FlgM n=1 Tax=Acidobacteriaceae bacterium ZG23-2 TaxID=2883246 RepID=UPI00406C195B